MLVSYQTLERDDHFIWLLVGMPTTATDKTTSLFASEPSEAKILCVLDLTFASCFLLCAPTSLRTLLPLRLCEK
jgi:hypothetical protein